MQCEPAEPDVSGQARKWVQSRGIDEAYTVGCHSSYLETSDNQNMCTCMYIIMYISTVLYCTFFYLYSTVEPHLYKPQLSGCSDYIDPSKHRILRASIENVLCHLYGHFSYTDSCQSHRVHTTEDPLYFVPN